MKRQKTQATVFAVVAIIITSTLPPLRGADDQKPATATAAPPPPAILPETVVTATRTDTLLEKTASTVTVISRQAIEDNQFKSLTSALRTVPGLTIADRGTPGSVAGVFLRGTKSEHTSVLLDGRPLPANLAGTFNIETLSLDNIERIEVLSGPASSLYGGKSIGGVINLITRTGKGLEKPEGSIVIEGGTHGTISEGASFRGSSGIVDYSGEISHFDTDGERINSNYTLSSATGHVGAQVTEDLYIDTDVRLYRGEGGVPGPAFGFGANDPDNRLETRYFSVSPGIEWQTTDWWMQKLTYVFSDFQQDATNFDFLGENNEIEVEEHFVEYLSEFRLTDHWQFTLGSTWQNRTLTRFNNDAQIVDIDSQEDNWSVFAVSQLEIAEGLNLIGSLRHDDYSLFDEATTGRIGVSYRLPVVRTLVHANYGTAFSPPSPQDVQPALFGNPLLAEPEESEGWEAGIEQPFWGDKGVVSATYFHNDIENLIQFDPTTFLLTQVGQARTEGVETAIKLVPCSHLELHANYTCLEAQNLTDDVRLVRRPRHQVNAGFVVSPVESVRFGLSGNYVVDREDGFGATQQPLEDYVNVRLTASWKINQRVEVFGRIDNLLDDEYQEVLGYPAYGRTFYAGLRVNF